MRIEEIKEKLLAAGIENAAQEARWLCESLSGDALQSAVGRRCSHYPLQYLLGEWDFCHENYEVSEACLIPRADTELLVERAAELLPRGARFLDLCTGSGCVAISTLAARVDTSALAVDLFDDTLALAKRNAVRNRVEARIEFRKADVLQAPPADLAGGYHAILSNPPYIRKGDMPFLQAEVKHEPAVALDGGEEGMDFYRAILEKWQPLLLPDGFFLFEIGYDQAAEIRELADEHRLSCLVMKDLGANDRTVLLRK